MGCGPRQYYLASPCPNCGQQDSEGAWRGARMGSTSWGHSYMCCSEKCGLEYANKLKTSKKLDQIAYHEKEIRRLNQELREGHL